ncbi:undecaprenyl-phosphate 4-deoxy-4-formamido-L-arabinose transferase [Neorhizobium huautlense]|uniref:Undecaprenyl-phosphate 4-deoxy-4-formamido-L-arabinose transferase n=1 Tax=Neorhizobium huautlense TaxID=67774 RepID=A0ABT9PUW3_9HYPH|nr:glycosyltransferase family 2 protein [Neorhizobium huautlense]MDP9838259.1 undecaprenyl-phosphate 4-deoxy-4-formamido-L-arabinose transferase [Neorhizobium huautlense]
MSTGAMEISVVVPVYRSAGILPELVRQVSDELSILAPDRYEVVLVNDRSPDHSWSVMRDLSKDRPWLKCISLRKNAGQHNAIMAGLNFAVGRIVIIMDDDLQHPPSALSTLAEKIREGADVCYTRYLERKHSTFKTLGSKVNDIAAGLLLKKPKGLYLSSFKALSGSLVKEIIRYDGPFTYVDGLILSVTDSIAVVEIKHGARAEGDSGYTLKKLLSLWLKMATRSSIPLRVATVSGFVLSLLSMLLFAAVIIERLIAGTDQPGWASTIAVLLFVSGVQMFFLGVLGEYVGRIYSRVNKEPQFTVLDAINTNGTAPNCRTSAQTV